MTVFHVQSNRWGSATYRTDRAARFGTLIRPLRYRVSHIKEAEMDWNRVEGNWKQVKGKVKEKWGKLTDDDLDVINGRRDQLEGKIQERYGFAKDQARKDIDHWYTAQKWGRAPQIGPASRRPFSTCQPESYR